MLTSTPSRTFRQCSIAYLCNTILHTSGMFLPYIPKPVSQVILGIVQYISQ